MELQTKFKDIIEDIHTLLNKGKQKIAVISHHNPDGDAIGSMLALYHFLRKLGHEVTAISPDDFPHFLHWMPGASDILIHYSRTKQANRIIAQSDIIFMVDFNHPERLNNFEKIIVQATAKKVLIDHHPNPHNFADITISDINVSSAAELIYLLIVQIGNNEIIDTPIASCLYCGMMTDTGCFSFNSSQPDTYLILANLLKSGIDKDNIFSKVYENYSLNRTRLMGFCLIEKMIVKEEFHTAIIALSRKELDAFKHQPGDTEGFVNLPFSIKNIIFTVFMMEKKDHIKMSFRSKNSFEANTFSEKHFNGGGHRNAAGGKSFASLDETIENFVNLLPQYKSKLKNALLP